VVNPGKQKKEDLDVWDQDRDKWDLRKIAETIENQKSFKFISDDDTDQLFVFEDGIWREKGESIIRRKCLELTNNLLRSKNIGQVKTIIKSRNEIYLDEEGFEPKDYVVPFQNGVYDVQEQEFRDFKKSDNFTFKHNVRYVDDAEEYAQEHDIDLDQHQGKTEEFLWDLQDTQRKVDILKETAALSLLSNYPIDEAPILYGGGSNGKNMYVRLLQEMTDNGHSINLDEMTDDTFAKKELENKTFVFFDEMQNINSPGKLKDFIGNENMRVRPMRDTGYMAKQRATPVIAANELPKAPEQNDGFFRRFKIVDFPFQFTSQDDGNKDKKPRGEIQEEYMNDHALNLFASSVVSQLKQVVKQEGFTSSQPIDVTRQQWNIRSSPVYSFLDQFVVQGEMPKYGSNSNSDKVIKDVLLNMANDYIQEVGGTELRQHELTKAISNNPDLELSSDGRKELADGRKVRAYSGLKLTLPNFHENQPESDLIEISSEIALKYWQHISDAQSYQAAQGLVIAETSETAKTIKYLESVEKDCISVLELSADLSFTESKVKEVMSSNLISVNDNDSEDSVFPKISIDREAFDQAVADAGTLTQDKQELTTLSDWMKDHIDSWSKSTVKKYGEVIDAAEDAGFDSSDVEDEIDGMLSDGILFEPQPGKVQKMG
jgi:putative DNA primase/helicase